MKFNTPSRLPIHGTRHDGLAAAVGRHAAHGKFQFRPHVRGHVAHVLRREFEDLQSQARHRLLEVALEKPALIVRLHVRKGVPIRVVVDALKR